LATFSDPSKVNCGGKPASPGERQYVFQPGFSVMSRPTGIRSSMPTPETAVTKRTALCSVATV